jgi:hypothetical protein
MSDKKFLYAASAMMRNEKDNEYRSYPLWVKARSQQEAIGMVIEQAKIDFPLKNGWINHQAGVIEIPNYAQN